MLASKFYQNKKPSFFMKKTVFILFLIFPFTLFAQTTKTQDIQKLIEVLQIKNNIQNMAGSGIELYKKQKPAVPQHVWNEILSSMDYRPYLNKVASIFDNNYTQAEIKHLLELANNAKPGRIPKFKPIVKEQIYTASNEFGKQSAELIAQQLKNKGY